MERASVDFSEFWIKLWNTFYFLEGFLVWMKELLCTVSPPFPPPLLLCWKINSESLYCWNNLLHKCPLLAERHWHLSWWVQGGERMLPSTAEPGTLSFSKALCIGAAEAQIGMMSSLPRCRGLLGMLLPHFVLTELMKLCISGIQP